MRIFVIGLIELNEIENPRQIILSISTASASADIVRRIGNVSTKNIKIYWLIAFWGLEICIWMIFLGSESLRNIEWKVSSHVASFWWGFVLTLLGPPSTATRTSSAHFPGQSIFIWSIFRSPQTSRRKVCDARRSSPDERFLSPISIFFSFMLDVFT